MTRTTPTVVSEQTVSSTPATRPTSPGVPQAWSAWANRHRQWVFAGPAMVFVAILLVFPLAWTVYLSLTDSSGSVRRAKTFVGATNYANVLTDTARFWPAVGRTVYFTAGALVVEVVLGMLIALLLWKPFTGQAIVRVAIILPLVATPVAVGMMWRLIFDPTIGFANYLLARVGLPPQPWLADQTTALPTLMFVDIWQWTPMVTLILLAGLTALPEEPHEAAKVDGASGARRFWHVTLPMLMPTVVTAVLLRGIDVLKTFDILYATKGLGGGSFHEAETLNVYAYGLSFDYFEYGTASTVLILFFALIVAAVIGLTHRKKVTK
ncbi:MAG: sugar ABC transporter permease [Propionibacteriaceae bacterium]|nr:sugar ABC transporter permease [Propionibacteriaceae bacterium]